MQGSFRSQPGRRKTALILSLVVVAVAVVVLAVILVASPRSPSRYAIQVSTDGLAWSGSIYVESKTGAVQLWSKNYSGSGTATFDVPADALSSCSSNNEKLWARFYITNYQGGQTIAVAILKNGNSIVSGWAYGNDAASESCPLT